MILLTGGTGAVGRAIATELVKRGEKLVLITRTKANVEFPGDMLLEEGNISDTSFLDAIFKKYSFETIIHCAWDGVTGAFRNSPGQINNFIATNNLLELAGANKVKTFIGLGSQAEYGVYNERISEDFLPQPQSLYGLYKLSCGLAGKILAEQYGFRFAWLRLFAAYGPNDNQGFLIPYALKSFLCNTSPNLSSCEQSWDYLFLPDLSKIVGEIVTSKHAFNSIYNLSSGKAQSLKSIIMLLKQITQSPIEPNFGAIQNRSDLIFLEGSNEKLFHDFQIKGLTDINKGLSLTVDWYKKNLTDYEGF